MKKILFVMLILMLISMVSALVSAKPDVRITEVEIQGARSEDIYPGETVEVRFILKNNEDRDLEDIEVEISLEDGRGRTLMGLDDEKIIYRDALNKINEKDEKSVRYSFRFPYDFDMSDDNEIVIKAQGDVEKVGSEPRDYFDLEENYKINVEKRKYDVYWSDFSLSKNTSQCGDKITLSYEIKNIGRDDEENLYVTINEPTTGVNYKSETFMMEEDPEGDNTFFDSFNFVAPDTITRANVVFQATLFMRNSVKKLSPSKVLTVNCNKQNEIRDRNKTIEEPARSDTPSIVIEEEVYDTTEIDQYIQDLEQKREDKKRFMILLIIIGASVIIIGLVVLIILNHMLKDDF